jgi:hypothetical protein
LRLYRYATALVESQKFAPEYFELIRTDRKRAQLKVAQAENRRQGGGSLQLDGGRAQLDMTENIVWNIPY